MQDVINTSRSTPSCRHATAAPRLPVAGEEPGGGFTLLELILALSLSVLIMLAIGMTVQLHLKSYDSRQEILEESQLARAILRIIADDIRGVVVHYKQDVSGVEAMLASIPSGETIGGGSGGQDQGDANEGDGRETEGGDSGGGGEGLVGIQNSGDDDSTLSEGGGLSSGSGTEDSTGTIDLSTTATFPTTPGIYGNQSQVQIDVSRLPRLDEYQAMMGAGPAGEMSDIPSDVKTVSYFVQTDSDAATAAALDPFAAEGSSGAQGVGLVRRVLDRAVTQWAMTNASATSLMQSGDLLASEVVGIEFQYFDGIEWRTEWDTEYNEGLPLAIQVVLYLGTAHLADPNVSDESAEVAEQPSTRYYRLVVDLPVGTPTAAEGTTGEETTESGTTESGASL